MNYVVTGSLGHISRPIVAALVKAGHTVRVITSNENRTAEIAAMGATAVVGDVADAAFVQAAFAGADAVYTMVPPTWTATNWKAHIGEVGKHYAAAIAANGIKHVVNLSSIGAHMPDGCGPVSGLYAVEQAMNALEGVDVVHLRPGFFYYNFMANIGMIKQAGIIGGNYGENAELVLVHPNDIAAVAVEELLHGGQGGKRVRYIVSDEKTTHEIAATLGAAIGKPELPWIAFRDEDTYNGMIQAGLSEEVAKNYTEMGAAVASGAMMSDYKHNKPALSPTKLSDFAKEFAAAYGA